MACENCNIDTKNDWSFCPCCGRELKRNKVVDYGIEDIFARLTDSLQSITRKMIFEGMRPQGTGKPGGLTIRVLRGAPGAASRNTGMRLAPSKRVPAGAGRPLRARPAPKKTIEPDARFNKLPGKLMVEVDAPGIKSEDDVDVLEMGTSVEVRAYSGETLYFKIINVPKRASVVSKKVGEGKIFLEMRG